MSIDTADAPPPPPPPDPPEWPGPADSSEGKDKQPDTESGVRTDPDQSDADRMLDGEQPLNEADEQSAEEKPEPLDQTQSQPLDAEEKQADSKDGEHMLTAEQTLSPAEDQPQTPDTDPDTDQAPEDPSTTPDAVETEPTAEAEPEPEPEAKPEPEAEAERGSEQLISATDHLDNQEEEAETTGAVEQEDVSGNNTTSADEGAPSALSDQDISTEQKPTGDVADETNSTETNSPAEDDTQVDVSGQVDDSATPDDDGNVPDLNADEAASEILVGAGGSWPTINEQQGGAVGQTTPDSCVSACGEMLSEGRLQQAELIKEINAPSDANRLATALGDGWKAGLADDNIAYVDVVTDTLAPCGVELYEGGKMSHMVVVDGKDESGNVLIRDPWDGGSTYAMQPADFYAVWNGVVVYK